MVLMHSIMVLAAAHRPPEADTCAANAFLNYTNLGNCHYSTILSLSGLEYSCSLSSLSLQLKHSQEMNNCDFNCE